MSVLDTAPRRVLKLSLVALMTKFAGAPLSYVMFVALAQVMSFEDYGKFAFAFSTVLVLVKFASAGQQEAVLKLLQTPEAQDTPAAWRGALWFSLRVLAAASLVSVLGLACFAVASGEAYLLMALPLVPLLAFSELQSAILRTRGRIVAALAPREILWRLGLILLAGWAIFATGSELSLFAVFSYASVTALLLFYLQTHVDPATRYWTSLSGPKTPADPAWWPLTGHLWAASVVTFATPNLAVAVIGTVLTPAASGPFFAALKTAQLLQLFLMAANIAATPLIARHYNRGARRRVQEICAVTSASAGVFALLCVLLLLLSGRSVLSVFGPGFDQAAPEMIILSIGFAFSALNGANGALLQMSGNEKHFTRIIVLSNGLGLVLLLPAVSLYGTFGAAAVVAGSMVSWNVLSWLACRKYTGIDPSIVGGLQLWRRG